MTDHLPEGHPSRDLSYWEAGFAAGLSAARDAVAALLPADYEANWCAALDAIDALRGDA